MTGLYIDISDYYTDPIEEEFIQMLPSEDEYYELLSSKMNKQS